MLTLSAEVIFPPMRIVSPSFAASIAACSSSILYTIGGTISVSCSSVTGGSSAGGSVPSSGVEIDVDVSISVCEFYSVVVVGISSA